MNTLTKHAKSRVQQRGMPPVVLEWLDAFGARERDGHGAEKVWFDKISRKRMNKVLGHEIVDRMGSLLDAYMVQREDGMVVTVGRIQKRITRH